MKEFHWNANVLKITPKIDPKQYVIYSRTYLVFVLAKCNRSAIPLWFHSVFEFNGNDMPVWFQSAPGAGAGTRRWRRGRRD